MTVKTPVERNALLLYGSETGTAQDFAEEVGRMVERLHFTTKILPLDATELVRNLGRFRRHAVLIDGDLPKNARQFWKKLLRRKLPPNCLENALISTFGLGDSSYPKFNWAARKLHKRLIQLGAKELYPKGEADAQHPNGLDAAFLPWSAKFREHLLDTFPLDRQIYPIPEDVLLEPKWSLALTNLVDTPDPVPLVNGDRPQISPNAILSLDTSNCRGTTIKTSLDNMIGPPDEFLEVTLDENRRITAEDHWQDVRHLVLTAKCLASYSPGDTMTIYPKNAEDDVNCFLNLMKWTGIADEPIKLTRTGLTDMISVPPIMSLLNGSPLTLRKLLYSHLDITAIPRRSFFVFIAHFARNPMQRGRILEFTSPEYVDELYDYTTRPRRSILEVLQEFDSVEIPWQWAATVLPELRGRQFSIASGGQLKKSDQGITRFELCIAIVTYKTVIKKIRKGVCTRYLVGLPIGSSMRVSVQRGGLAIRKADATRPVVMIGPGTGVAPMRSLIWERLQWSEDLESQERDESLEVINTTRHVAESILFFGCRNQDKDFFYEEEWKELETRMDLKVFKAFSRDQKKKVYVQDLVREQSNLVFRLLYQFDGVVYICGSSGKMPQAVREALIEVFQNSNSMKREDAEAYLLRMEKDGRYKQETW